MFARYVLERLRICGHLNSEVKELAKAVKGPHSIGIFKKCHISGVEPHIKYYTLELHVLDP
jgi:hypothetical protein